MKLNLGTSATKSWESSKIMTNSVWFLIHYVWFLRHRLASEQHDVWFLRYNVVLLRDRLASVHAEFRYYVLKVRHHPKYGTHDVWFLIHCVLFLIDCIARCDVVCLIFKILYLIFNTLCVVCSTRLRSFSDNSTTHLQNIQELRIKHTSNCMLFSNNYKQFKQIFYKYEKQYGTF